MPLAGLQWGSTQGSQNSIPEHFLGLVQPWRTLSLIPGGPWGVGSKRRPGREPARDRSPGPLQGTLPAQVGVPGPSLLLTLLQASLLYANPETKHLEFQARWAGHSKVFLFIPGFTGGEFCLKAPSMRGHPGKEQKTGNPYFTNRSFTLQKDPPRPSSRFPSVHEPSAP